MLAVCLCLPAHIYEAPVTNSRVQLKSHLVSLMSNGEEITRAGDTFSIEQQRRRGGGDSHWVAEHRFIGRRPTRS